jgi:3-deoxy-7-phosphoheptulonate synthase
LITADEMVNPQNHDYLDDILGYVTIGARTSRSQHHQEVASGSSMPIGVKNPLNGSVKSMVNSINGVQKKQVYMGREDTPRYTTGNPFAHGILRGANFDDGTFQPNYHYENILDAINCHQKLNLKNLALLIDCNHGNSGKKPYEQPRIANEVLENMKRNYEIFNAVKGFMIEGYLLGGSQSVKKGRLYKPGTSITDPCQGWETTKEGIGTQETLIAISKTYGELSERYGK